MEEKQLSEFLEKFSSNQYTEQEHQVFIDWLHSLDLNEVEKIMEMYQDVAVQAKTIAYPQLGQRIEERLNTLHERENARPKLVLLWPKLRKGIAAACLLGICGTIGIYFLNNGGKHRQIKTNIAKSEIAIGGNKAILKLANGSEIILDAAKTGKLASQGSTAIYKSKDGQVVFDATKTDNQKNGNALAYNTLSTPRGGQYVIKLPDGSSVWLNSASSLKFPAAFIGKTRTVELTGEAYFEITKDESKPFRVKTATQDVEVLGTHFNINSYSDEPVVSTTLLEGSVKVSQLSSGKTQLLKPGQQSRIGTDIKVFDVDADQFIDWKEGYFKFSRESIQSIMRKVSRWYDVDIDYEGNITKEGFVGTVPRSKDITEVLNALKLTGVINYKIEGKRITITP